VAPVSRNLLHTWHRVPHAVQLVYLGILFGLSVGSIVWFGTIITGTLAFCFAAWLSGNMESKS
jgi:uncharacterized membrane protein YdjX (TVP38/TMEM64 family)